MNHTMSVFLHLQSLNSMIMVSLSLPIVQVPLFLWLFLIGHTLTTSTSPKWFSMNDLNLKSDVVPSGAVSNSPSLSPLLYCFSFHFFQVLRNCINCFRLKFGIKVLVHINFVLKVREEAMQEYGYNLQRVGWLNVFIDEKNQTMGNDWVPWRGAHEKHDVFFLYPPCYHHPQEWCYYGQQFGDDTCMSA